MYFVILFLLIVNISIIIMYRSNIDIWKEKKDSRQTSAIGTVAYASPEQQRQTNIKNGKNTTTDVSLITNTYNEKTDMFSQGLVFLEMWRPFNRWNDTLNRPEDNISERYRVFQKIRDMSENNFSLDEGLHEQPREFQIPAFYESVEKVDTTTNNDSNNNENISSLPNKEIDIYQQQFTILENNTDFPKELYTKKFPEINENERDNVIRILLSLLSYSSVYRYSAKEQLHSRLLPLTLDEEQVLATLNRLCEKNSQYYRDVIEYLFNTNENTINTIEDDVISTSQYNVDARAYLEHDDINIFNQQDIWLYRTQQEEIILNKLRNIFQRHHGIYIPASSLQIPRSKIIIPGCRNSSYVMDDVGTVLQLPYSLTLGFVKYITWYFFYQHFFTCSISNDIVSSIPQYHDINIDDIISTKRHRNDTILTEIRRYDFNITYRKNNLYHDTSIDDTNAIIQPQLNTQNLEFLGTYDIVWINSLKHLRNTNVQEHDKILTGEAIRVAHDAIIQLNLNIPWAVSVSHSGVSEVCINLLAKWGTLQQC